MMCELPSNAVIADAFLDHFDGFSIGSNDMTQLTLGIDRDSSPGRRRLRRTRPRRQIHAERRHHRLQERGKYVGICGQGPSDHPDLAEWLLDQGIESMSLNPDTVVDTWNQLASLISGDHMNPTEVTDAGRPRGAPSVSYSITVRLEVPAGGTAVSQLTTAVEHAGGAVTALDVTASGHERLRIDVTCAARDTEHAEQLVEAMRQVDGRGDREGVSDRTFLMHLGGKIEMHAKHPIRNRDDLSMIYTPGVARVCLAIAKNPEDARRLTIKRNSVAVVTDGSAVLGLGNIGPEAALPVMEGKAALFKRFGGIDAWPLCLDTQDVDEIVAVVKAIAPGFAGINLEDISAPRCFEIERRLRELLDIPVFHDDQHGTAIVVLAALLQRAAGGGQGDQRRADRDVRRRRGRARRSSSCCSRPGPEHVVVADIDGVVHRGRRGL